jgi:peptidoglycan/LPS O-acetylase OafA/YrhL
LTVHTTDSLTYRSDVDGLRAFAVIAVIAFHANEQLLSGGFAGVDIFFVISGFLISGQIARDVGKGTFTFSNFYNRRIKRILPVYAVVSLFVSLASLYLLNTNDLVYFTTSLAASWLFASNVFFALLSGGYFDVHVKLFPLLHTWSLGVEEQFYFVFPVLFVVLLRRQRRHALMIACALLIAFVAISQLNSAKPSSYYLLQYRAHELLIGIISFLLTRDAPIRRAAPANVLCAAGLLLMIGSLVLLSPNSVYPGVNSLYPCIGAGLVIYSGHKAKLFHPLLMNRVIVFVGLISYSLYLWHWPVFSLLQYRGIRLSPLVTLAAISAITAMSCISWRVVEKPIRENRRIHFATAVACFFALPACVFLALGAISYESGGLPQRFAPNIRELMSSYSRESTLLRACSQRLTDQSEIGLDSLLQECSFGDGAPKSADVLLFGDSHASHYKPFVDVLARESHRRAVYHVMGTCPPLMASSGTEAAPGSQPQSLCAEHNMNLINLARDFRFVIVAGYWGSVGTNLESGLSQTIDAISAAGAIPVVFRDTPRSDRDLSQCVVYRARGWLPSTTDCNIPYAEVLRKQAAENQVIDRIKAQHPTMIVIDPRTILCNATECLTEIDGLAVFRDSNHINEKAARDMAMRYMAVSGNPLRR